MHNDEQYGHQLGAHLRQETRDVRAPAGLAGALRRRLNRRTWALRAAIATPVAAAAAVVAVLAATAGPASTAANTTQPASTAANTTHVSTVQLENVAYVTTNTINALGQASDFVIYARTTYSTGYYDEWIDKATQRYRNDVYTNLVDQRGVVSADGQLHVPTAPPPVGPMRLVQSHSLHGPVGNQTSVTVDYDDQWWSAEHVTEAPPAVLPDVTDAAAVKAAIDDGTVVLLGPETVDGQQTLHLRLDGPDGSYRIDMWLDQTTWLPVRVTAVKGGGAATLPTVYSWLPRTGENLAKLVLTPPPGFKKLG